MSMTPLDLHVTSPHDQTQPLSTGGPPVTNIAPAPPVTQERFTSTGIDLLQTELATVIAERDALLAQITHTLGPPLHEYAARTRARESTICRDNRVKNAWCAYHDTAGLKAEKLRPERTLSCNCTFGEALFEEELARNGVGSLVVTNEEGEKMVRLHPSLRRSLLRLLVERYGYKDGDFDIDPTTGQWKDGQQLENWTNAEGTAGPSA